MPTARLETFADGVFAIAATLLIIDVTADAPGGGLGRALTHSWPEYAAYGVSFLTIGIMWVNHHACLDQIGRGDRRFLFANIALLACIAFVPFPTRLVLDARRGLERDGLRDPVRCDRTLLHARELAVRRAGDRVIRRVRCPAFRAPWPSG